MSGHLLRCAVLTALIGSGLGCGRGPTAPADPLVVFATAYRYQCAQWTPGPPPDDRSQFDVLLSQSRFADDVANLERAGIAVVYRFSAGSQVRVEARVSRLLQVVAPMTSVHRIDSVRDPLAYALQVTVGLPGPPTPADVAVVTSLGGQVVFVPSQSPFLSVVIDDRNVASLRGHPAVRFVEISGPFCLL